MSNLENHYDDSFYEGQSTTSIQSALATLPYLFDLVRPESAIDFGCGVGTWLKAAKQLGVTKLDGVEGPWVRPEQIIDDEINLTNTNFDAPEIPEGQWDVAMSLEVAEHIETSSSESFVKGICSSSDTVIFSAAIPRQLGENHINEQWQSYWAALFQKQGFEVFDLIRPQIWTNQDVEWYYRQNILVYCKPGSKNYDAIKTEALEVSSRLLDIVHPEVFTNRTSLRGGLVSVKKALLNR